MPSRTAAEAEEAALPDRRASSGLWSDFASFFARRPAKGTHIDLSLPQARQEYDRRVFERLGVSVAENDVLNIHRIGIHAPPGVVWDLWAQQDSNQRYWPTRIAFPAWRENGEEGELLLFGRPSLRLFRAELIRRRDIPLDSDPNGARYLLYRCTGGYPMGIFATYVRPNDPARDEIEATQIFFMVAFDFFGRKHWLGRRAIRPFWESIHNRVTSQVLNLFKAHCEAAYARTQGCGHVATGPAAG